MKINRKTFFDEVKKSLFPDKFGSKEGAGQIAGLDLLISEIEKRNTSMDDAAYILATVYHETAKTIRPVREYGTDKYLKAKKYWPYIGRGYAQLTWDFNYQKAKDKYGVDFIKNPDLAMEPQWAVQILFDGMTDGWFTGKDLDDFIDEVKESDAEDLREWRGARKIVNGTDKADLIAGYALKFRDALYKSWITNEEPLKKSTPEVVGGTMAAGAGAVVFIEPIKDLATSIATNQGLLTAGSWMKFVVGLLIIGGAAYVLFARWDAAGRPKFWKRG